MFEMGTFCVPGKKRRRQRRKNRETIFSLYRQNYKTGILIENKICLDDLLFILPTQEKRMGGTFVPRVFGPNKKNFFNKKNGGKNGGRKFFAFL